MNIEQYFEQVYGRKPTLQAGFDQLPVDSNCGKDCRAVIDAGKVVLDLIDPSCHDDFLSVIEDAIAVFWVG